MTPLSALVAAAALALAATAALAQGKAGDAQRHAATPAAGRAGQAAKRPRLASLRKHPIRKEFNDQVEQGRPDQDPDARGDPKGAAKADGNPRPQGTLGRNPA
jgi:hypothetical protein